VRAGAAVAAVAAVAALVAISAVAIGGPTPSVPTATLHLGGKPVAVVADGQTLWVAGPSGRVWKVVPSRPTQHRSAGKIRPSAIAVGARGVWVVGPGAPWVWRFDPAPFAAAERIRVPGPPFAVAAGPGAVWVTIPDQHLLVRIAPKSKHVVAKIPVTTLVPRAVALIGNEVWVADPGVAVAQIDSKTKSVAMLIQLRGARPQEGIAPLSCSLAAGAGALWMANPVGSVTRIDPSKGHVVASIAVGGHLAGITAVGGSVWVTDAEAGSVARIDPETDAVTARLPVGAGPGCVGVTPMAVWVATAEAGALIRLGGPAEPQPGRAQA